MYPEPLFYTTICLEKLKLTRIMEGGKPFEKNAIECENGEWLSHSFEVSRHQVFFPQELYAKDEKSMFKNYF